MVEVKYEGKNIRSNFYWRSTAKKNVKLHNKARCGQMSFKNTNFLGDRCFCLTVKTVLKHLDPISECLGLPTLLLIQLPSVHPGAAG